MDVKNLKRDKEKVLSYFKETPSNSIIVTEDCYVQFPSRFIQRELGDIDIGVEVYGLFALVFNDTYAVLNFASKVILNSNIIEYVQIDDVEYINVMFRKNDVMIINTNLVKKETVIFDILDEIIFKGKIPWYTTYDDLIKMLDTAKPYAGMNLNNLMGAELLASMCGRCDKDRTKYYRTCSDSEIFYIGLRNVFYSATSTLTKLSGSYLNDGIKSALLSPTKDISELEKAVRA